MTELNKNEQHNNYDQQPKKGNVFKMIAMGLLVFALIILITGFSVWIITAKKQSENKQNQQSKHIEQQTFEKVNETYSDDYDEKMQEQNASDIFSQRKEEHERKIICGDGICDLPEMVNNNCLEDCGKKAPKEHTKSRTEIICGDAVCDLFEMANKNCPQDCGKQ